MEDTCEVILRQGSDLQSDMLLVNPPDAALLGSMPQGFFVSLHYGHWQALQRQSSWPGQFGLDQSLEHKVSHAVVWMPKARRELDLLVAWVQSQMRPGAKLWLVGAKRGGIESGGKLLRAKFGSGSKRDSARHCQLWEYRIDVPEGGFAPNDWVCERSAVVSLPQACSTATLNIADMPGIFSEGRVDDGTQLLLRSLPEKSRSPVLDFACGAGVIAATLLKQWPKMEATLVDVQWQALITSRHTLAANGMKADVRAGDGLTEIDGHFGWIITNPPFHTGLKTDLSVVRAFIVQAKAHLLPGGELWLVANAFLPYRELLEEQFQVVNIVAEDSRFRVYQARASETRHKRR